GCDHNTHAVNSLPRGVNWFQLPPPPPLLAPLVVLSTAELGRAASASGLALPTQLPPPIQLALPRRVSFPPHVRGFLVFAQPDELRVPQVILPSPLQKLDLGH